MERATDTVLMSGFKGYSLATSGLKLYFTSGCFFGRYSSMLALSDFTNFAYIISALHQKYVFSALAFLVEPALTTLTRTGVAVHLGSPVATASIA